MSEVEMCSDSLLSLLSANDEKKAFDIIFKRNYPKVKLFILGFCNDEFEAENITQDIFLKLWIKRKEIAHIGKLDPYLFSMARNATLNALKRALRQRQFGEKEADVAARDSVEELIYSNELQEQINRGIACMPSRQRRVFEMSRMEGLSNEEIAERLHLSKRTVETHISAALKELRRLLPALMVEIIVHSL